MKVFIVLVFLAVIFGGKEVSGEVRHHLIGGDHGWDPAADINSWSSGRVFRVNDKLWFAYPVAKESIVELQSKDEFESCDLKNPIKMYTDGPDHIVLDREGTRFFASADPDRCKNGLKLHLDVQPPEEEDFPREEETEAHGTSTDLPPEEETEEEGTSTEQYWPPFKPYSPPFEPPIEPPFKPEPSPPFEPEPLPVHPPPPPPPAEPSASAQLNVISSMSVVGIFLCFMGL